METINSIFHIPVFKRLILKQLLPLPGGKVCDFTLGEGGHTEMFLQKGCHVTAFERDPDVLKAAEKRLQKSVPDQCISFKPIADNFINTSKYFPQDIPLFDLAFFDLGISMFHYKGSGRGFSHRCAEKPDMRLSPDITVSAYEIINSFETQKLKEIIKNYGEERYAGRIANKITKVRENGETPQTAEALADLIASTYPPSKSGKRAHPAVKTFQALRIYVNRELDAIGPTVEKAAKLLKKNGKLAVISYHSLEDQIVKHTFKKFLTPRQNTNKYRKEPEEKKNHYRLMYKKPVVPDEDEIRENRAARSAKLRVLIRESLHEETS